MSYRTVKESFWTDPKIRQLSSDEKLLFLYCVTNPHSHYSGIYYLPITFMVEETGMTQKSLIQCLTKLESRLLIRYDKATSTMFVVKMFKHQNSTGGNPKVIRSGVEKQLQNCHSYVLINAFIEEYQYLNLTMPQGCDNVDSTFGQGTVPDTVPDTVPVPRKKKSKFGKDAFLEACSDQEFISDVKSGSPDKDVDALILKMDTWLKDNDWKNPKTGRPYTNFKSFIRGWVNRDEKTFIKKTEKPLPQKNEALELLDQARKVAVR